MDHLSNRASVDGRIFDGHRVCDRAQFFASICIEGIWQRGMGKVVSSELDLPSSSHSQPIYLTSSPILAMLSLGVLGSARPPFRQWMAIK